MQTLPHFPHKSEREHQLAGLPDFRRGRIVTASSDVDSWRAKHPAIQRRLEAGRRLRGARA